MHLNFLSIYDDCFDDIYRFIYYKTNSKWDCDDLVSETFRKAYENYASLNGNPRPWLFAIARNTVYDYYRKKQVNSPVGLEEADIHDYQSIEEEFDAKDDLDCLKKSINILVSEDLEIINMKYFSGLKYEEIGKILDKTPDAVKMRMSRILKKLKVLVSKCMEV